MTSFSLGRDMDPWMGSADDLHESLQAPSSLTLTLSQLIMSFEIRASLVRSSSRAALKPRAIRETCRTCYSMDYNRSNKKISFLTFFYFLVLGYIGPQVDACVCAYVRGCLCEVTTLEIQCHQSCSDFQTLHQCPALCQALQMCPFSLLCLVSLV